MQQSQSFLHDCIIDKTCIDRIIEHDTNSFHKEHLILMTMSLYD